MLRAVPAQIRHVQVNVVERYGTHQVNIHGVNTDFIQRSILRNTAALKKKKPEKIPQI
ncbi:hypothetical protein SDC9_195200 [bioreactor metagenome]|uniref:Uncharacterized protein n=1 Tax=bioreactor metagenome TaxID=1076179 RepID=A0A645I8C3_9ZZZZ